MEYFIQNSSLECCIFLINIYIYIDIPQSANRFIIYFLSYFLLKYFFFIITNDRELDEVQIDNIRIKRFIFIVGTYV